MTSRKKELHLQQREALLTLLSSRFEKNSNRHRDHEAWESRKAHKSQSSVMEMASETGIELLTEEQYQWLQQLGNFDTKTSSWLATRVKRIPRRTESLKSQNKYAYLFVS